MRPFVCLCVCVFVGLLAWLKVSHRDKNGRAFHDQMHSVQKYLTVKNVPKKLAVLIRKHFRAFFLAKVAMQESGLLDALSPALRADLSAFLIDGRCADWLSTHVRVLTGYSRASTD